MARPHAAARDGPARCWPPCVVALPPADCRLGAAVFAVLYGIMAGMPMQRRWCPVPAAGDPKEGAAGTPVSAVPHPHLWPDSAAVSAEGRLCVGGLDLVTLAGSHGTPLYIYDEATLHAG